MKSLSLVLFLVFITTYGKTQTNFPGKYPIVLLDREVTIKPLPAEYQKYGYPGFYKDGYATEVYACCNRGNSKYNALVHKKFKVFSVDPFTDADGSKKFVLTLGDSLNRQVFFYYDPKDESYFPFEVTGGLEIPLSFYCIDITYKTQESTGDTLYYSDPEEQIIFTKMITKEGNHFFLKVYGLSANDFAPGKGVSIFLQGDKQLNKPSEIIKMEKLPASLDEEMKFYMYWAYISLDEEDVSLLKQYSIKEVKMSFLAFKTTNGVKFQNYLRCLSK